MTEESKSNIPAVVGYIFLGTLALFFIGFLLLLKGWASYRPLDDSIIPTAFQFLILPSIIFSWLLLRYGVKSYKQGSKAPTKVKFGLFIFSMNGITIFLFGGFIIVNGMFDNSSEMLSSAQIIEKKISRSGAGFGMGFDIYYLYYTHISGERLKDNRVEVNRDFYNRAQTGDILSFKVHKGFLGFQWGNDLRSVSSKGR